MEEEDDGTMESSLDDTVSVGEIVELAQRNPRTKILDPDFMN